MMATNLTYEQNSIVNAVWTLINNMDDKMRDALMKRLNGKQTSTPVRVKTSRQTDWHNYPISKEVMSMTFEHRKPIGNYKERLEDELNHKYGK